MSSARRRVQTAAAIAGALEWGYHGPANVAGVARAQLQRMVSQTKPIKLRSTSIPPSVAPHCHKSGIDGALWVV